MASTSRDSRNVVNNRDSDEQEEEDEDEEEDDFEFGSFLNRRHNDDQDEDARQGYQEGRTIDKKFKNTLESDEEDDELEAERKNRLNATILKHQEKKTIDMDGDIKVTPFNMNDEMEEGHFDKAGNFIFDKLPGRRDNNKSRPDDDDEEDAWADNVENMIVYEPKNGLQSTISNQPYSDGDSNRGVKRKQAEEDNSREHSRDSVDRGRIDHVRQFRKMLSFMLPDETVQATIKRLGKNVPRGRQFKPKHQTDADKAKTEGDKEKLNQFIELAHNIMETVDLDIYEKTYEHLTMQVKSAPSTSAAQNIERDLDSDDD